MAKIYVQVGTDVYELDKGQEDLFSSGTVLKPKEGKAKYLAQCKAELRACFLNQASAAAMCGFTSNSQMFDNLMFAVIRSVASSGMSRMISFHVHCSTSHGPTMKNISALVASVLGWKHRDGAVVVKGCGMDMVHHTAESLSRLLYDNPDRISTQTL